MARTASNFGSLELLTLMDFAAGSLEFDAFADDGVMCLLVNRKSVAVIRTHHTMTMGDDMYLVHAAVDCNKRIKEDNLKILFRKSISRLSLPFQYFGTHEKMFL